MVTTRRQSARSSSNAAELGNSPSTAKPEADGNFPTTASSKAKCDDRPAAKRRKVKGSSATRTIEATNAVKAKLHWDLSLIMTMPLDVVYEILSQLALIDLINVAKVNRSWRKILLETQAGMIWKVAREAGKYPEPPEDFTEQRWARFLLCKVCQCCGSKLGWQSPDWLLLRRVCAACRRRHLVDVRCITERRFPNVDKDIVKYIPHSNDGGWDYHPCDRYYWAEDILRISAEWAAIQDPEARRAWEAERAAAIAKRREMVAQYSKWQSDAATLRWQQERKDREARLEAFKVRFVEAGYAREDVDNSLDTWSPGINAGSPNVTNAVWARSRAKLEQRIRAVINARLAEELRPTVDKRMKILEGVYTAYLESLRPSERLCCPPIEILHPIPEILEILEAPKEIEITQKEFQPFKRKFKKYIADFQAKVKGSLNEEAKEHAGSFTGNSFDLARIVFQRKDAGRRFIGCRFRGFRLDWAHPDDMILVGWPMINAYSTTHRSSQQLRDGVYISMPARFAVNRYSSLVSGKLVKLAGMNPRTATVREMDRRDPRFVHTAFFTEKGYPVLTWRVALSLYAAFRGQKLDTDQSFRLATPEEEAQAKQSEESLRPLSKAWSCNHCHDFLEASEAKSQTFILEHLRSSHGIAAPKILKDYFLNERCRHTYEVPSEIAIPDWNVELFKCKCTRCHQEVVEKRRFTAKGIQEHFAWAHNRDPVLGVDFVVSRTAMPME